MKPQVGDIWAFGTHTEKYLLVSETVPDLFLCLEMTTGRCDQSYWVNPDRHWRKVA